MWRHINCPIYHLLFLLCPRFPTYIEHHRPPLAEEQTSIMIVKQERIHKHVLTTVWVRMAKDKKITAAYLYDWQCFSRNSFGTISVTDMSKTIAFVFNFVARMPSTRSKALVRLCRPALLVFRVAIFYLCGKAEVTHISNLDRRRRSNVVNSCLPYHCTHTYG